MSRASLPKRTSTLDSQAIEAVVRFVRVLARCGCTPKDIAQEVLKAGREVPKSWAQTARSAIREIDVAVHVLTVWFAEPAYLDPKGNPRPLPLHGPGLSLEALSMRVDRSLDPQKVLRHLLDTRALRRLGTRYVPRDRLVSFRGSGGPDYSRSLRGLLAMLRTIEHNTAPARSTPGWFEVYALNPCFPAKDRAAFDRRLRQLGMRFLVQIDSDMHRRERRRKKGERTVPLGVAIYRFEEQPLHSRSRRRRPKRSSK
jgi:Family of unknown function (DUF6502)